MLYEWVTNRDLQILSSPYRPVSEVDHEDWVRKAMNRSNEFVVFVIQDAEKSPIGICKLTNIDWTSRNAELQIRIGKSTNQGKGLGTIAVSKLCEFGFRDLGLVRIQLFVWSSNQRAIRSYEKAGFSQEGILRKAIFVDGKFQDVYLMSKLDFE
jgi:RimJ/RimL family protein N-acetyltransferase